MVPKRLFLLVSVIVIAILLLSCGSTPTAAPAPTAKPAAPTAAPAPTSAAAPTAKPAAPAAAPTAKPAAPAAPAAPTAAPAATALPTQNWVLATSGEGTVGYTVAAGMARVADKYAKGTRITVLPGYSTTASHQVYEKGEANIAYINLFSMQDSWTNTGAFAKTPLSYRLYHGFYYSTSVHTVVTNAERTDIRSLGDLAGKKFFPFTTGSGSQLLWAVISDQLKLTDKITERQMGTGQITDAVKNNLVDAVWLYVSGPTLSATWADLDMRVTLRVVEPSAAEKAVITKIPGVVAPVPITVKGLFTHNLGVDSIWGVGLPFGLGFGPGEDAERVYQIVKAWYEHTGELLAVGSTFTEVSQKGVQLTVQAIDSLPDIPVHPGVAKYMKEKGVWKNNWKIGDVYPRKK